MLITDSKLYDNLKWVALVLLPALGTLYVALGALWDLPNVSAVTGTILAVDTFLGALLHLSNSTYKASGAAYDGTVDVTDTGDKKTFSLNLNVDPQELDKQNALTLKINPVQPPDGANGF